MAKQVKLLVVGGLNGFFSAGFSKIASINKKHGPFDLLLCVGDFFGSDDDQSTGGNDELEKLMNGQIKVPLAAYIVGSKSRFPKDISEKIKSNHGEICQDLAYIGNHGVMTTIDGLRIAFLSGVSVADEDPSLPTSSERYTQASVEELIQLCTSKAAMSTLPPVTDILLTSEAPEGLSNGSSASLDIYNPKESDESRHIAQLVTALQPRYHFAGGTSGFFEREPYLNVMGAKHVTRFIRLGDFRPKTKGRWFYAMNIVPAPEIEATQLQAKPANTTSFPFFSEGQSRKRDMDTTGDSFFFEPSNVPTKKGRRAPPSSYVCRRCDQPGHWKEDCTKRSARPPPDGYVCRICGESTHYIRDCPKGDSNSSQKMDPIANRDASLCWFCLSNPALEKHLIVNIEEESYLTLAKGGLSEWGGHLLIVPIAHQSSSIHLRKSADAESVNPCLEEMNRMKTEIRDAFAKKDSIMVCFEIFSGSDGGERDRLQHMHVQVVSLPAELVTEVEREFLDAAEKAGLEVVDENVMDQASMDDPFIRLDLPISEDYSLPLKTTHKTIWLKATEAAIEENNRLVTESQYSGRRPPRLLDIQFGRRVLATLMGKPDSVNWKNCILPEDKEVELTLSMRNLLTGDST